MNGNRNQTATGEMALFQGGKLAPRTAAQPLKTQCLQMELNHQPSGNECISGAVEHGFSGHKTPGNLAPDAEHRAKGRAKTATERQSWDWATVWLLAFARPHQSWT